MITEDWTFTYSDVNADYFLFSWLMNPDPFQTFLFTLPTTVSTVYRKLLSFVLF